jgi:hypothetical protein
MNEANWQTSNNPDRMQKYLRSKFSRRKERLFSVACCRRIWHLIPDERSRLAVELAEQYADGQLTEEEFALVQRLAEKAADEAQSKKWYAEADANFVATPDYCKARANRNAAEAAACACLGRHSDGRNSDYWAAAAIEQTTLAEVLCIFQTRREWMFEVDKALRLARARQAAILREIFGGRPFRRLFVDPVWMSWNDSTVPNLSQRIYNDRAFNLMPILADALEAAGCRDAAILDHCRQPGEHVRGCWVLDLLLGKE